MKYYHNEKKMGTKKPHYGVINFYYLVSIFLLGIFSLFDNSYAQIRNYVFEHISLKMGLSQSTILSIIQDQKGYLWLGTEEGLNKYDGYKFTIYRTNPANPGSISDNWITALIEDKNGDLWIATNSGGLNLYKRFSDHFIKYRHDVNNPSSLSSDRISALYEDRSGYIWIGTDGGGINRFDKQKQIFERYQFNVKSATSIYKNDITAICEDHEGNLWWGTDGDGVYCWNWETVNLRHYNNDPEDKSSLSHNRILSVYCDQQGILWIGTNGGGLNKFLAKTQKFIRYKSNFSNPYSLSNDFVYAIFEDRSGKLWIGTDDGLNQYLPESESFYVVKSKPGEPTSLSNNMIRSIYEDRGNILWVGTLRGALNKFDNKKAAFKNYRQNPANSNSLSDKNVWTILEDNRKFIWIGTNNGLNKLDRKKEKFVHYFHDPADKNSIAHNIVRYIYQDRKGILWIGTDGGGISKFNYEQNSFEHFPHNPNDETSLSDNGLRCIFEDSKENLWVGTINGLNKFDREHKIFKRYLHDPLDSSSITDNHIRCIFEDTQNSIWIATFNGLNLYMDEQDKFIPFKNDPSNPYSLSNNRVLCIYEDTSNRFWLGTYGGGLNKLDREVLLFSNYSTEDGLPNSVIYGILEDKQGNLWMSTNQGLSKYNPETNTFKNYDVNDGLQSNEFNGNAFYQNAQGEMFFGGINGVTVFHPEQVKDNDNVPSIVISKFKKYDEEIYFQSASSIEDRIDLSYKDDFFSFEFVALDFTNPLKNQYAYKLEGFDKDWIFCGNRRFANYTNIDGGNYVFRVKGSNNNGVWNTNDASIKVIIHPPFWRTWWFKLVMLILIIAVVYIVITLWMRSVNALKRRLEFEVSQRTRELNQSNYELLRAKKDTDDILNNVEEGLFLLNSDFKLASGYSLALEKIFGEQNLAHRNFITLLGRKVLKNVVKNTQEYLELMFRNDVDEESLQALNPLSEIEMSFSSDNENGIRTKYLLFNFKRIYENGQVVNLIATVSDITEQVILERKLKQTEKRTQNQMEWLVNILHLEPVLLYEFIEGAENELNYIDSLLKRGGGNGKFLFVLEEIYRSVNMIKGNASLLDLKFFVELTHQFEERISETKKMNKVRGNDFIPLVIYLSEVRQSLNEVKKLTDRISNFHDHFDEEEKEDNHLLIKSIKNLVYDLAGSLKKEVNFIYDDFKYEALPKRYRLLVKDILTQFVRNSIYHGIESPQERVNKGKRSNASIKLSCEFLDGQFSFRYRDDGRGIQIDRIRNIVMKDNKIDKKEIDKMNQLQIAQFIFEPGFTIVDKAHRRAVRVIGLDRIKSKIKEHGGNINIDFEEGKFCEFVVTIPLNKNRRTQISERKQILNI